jgi:hypothetical protein
MTPFSDGVSFAPGTTLKFGRPLPAANPVLLPMAQASLHQSRVC